MLQDDEYLYHSAVEIGGREFLLSVLHDGTVQWLEFRALTRAGGAQHLEDFVGKLLGNQRASGRFHNRVGEFQITTEPDESVMDLLRLAGMQDEYDAQSWPDGLSDSLDAYFLKRFWTHVNPMLPDPIVSR